MPRGSPAIKMAITVDSDVYAKVVRAASREHKSVSAWMTEAARRALLARDGLAAVAAWEAEHGALSEAARRVRSKARLWSFEGSPVSTVYDTGMLIAADRNERAVWAEHRVRLAAGLIPLVPANVVAQASRNASSSRRPAGCGSADRQVQLRRFLRGCAVVPFDERAAHRAGTLLGKTKTADVVDAAVVDLAATTSSDIVTMDPKDIARLVAATGKRIKVQAR